MSDKPANQRSEADDRLERDIRAERKFSLGEAIGRLAGPGCMKGASPVLRKQQVEVEIADYLRRELTDASGALKTVLLRYVRHSDHLLNNYDQPLEVLSACVHSLLGSEYVLKELVRETDAEWGKILNERPHFEQEGSPPHPDDPYTREAVRRTLLSLVEKLPPSC